MFSRSLGRTGLSVSPLGLGLAALGRPGYINLGHAADLGPDHEPALVQAHAHAVLDAAFAAGIRYFDTARSYGEGERFLASWLRLRAIPAAHLVIGSKWGYTYTAGWSVLAKVHEVKDHTLPVLRRQSQESRSLLGAYLNLYQIHSATLDSGVLQRADVLTELARLREGGWKIGLSVTGVQQADTIRQALAVRLDGLALFDVVQATWNLLEPSAGPALAEARQAGLGVIVKEALANGRLTSRNVEPGFVARSQALERTAARLGCALDALALAAILARPWADVVLSGAATVEQLRENVRALEVRWDDEAEASTKVLAEPADVYWTTRGGLAWN